MCVREYVTYVPRLWVRVRFMSWHVNMGGVRYRRYKLQICGTMCTESVLRE